MGRSRRLPFHRRWTAALAAVLLLVGAAGALTLPRASASPPPDDGCPASFPVRVTPEGSGMYGTALARLVVCQTAGGTGSLVYNDTAAVWVLDGLRAIAVHRDRASLIQESFLDLFGGPDPVLPPGYWVAVPAPASRLTARVDPRLTLAALAHERLAMTLLAATPEGFRPQVLGASRSALASCLDEMLDRMPSPAALLSRGNPGRRIADAAADVASTPGSECVREWNRAKVATAFFGLPLTPLAQDVALWRANPSFAFRALDAAITYSALGGRLFR